MIAWFKNTRLSNVIHNLTLRLPYVDYVTIEVDVLLFQDTVTHTGNVQKVSGSKLVWWPPKESAGEVVVVYVLNLNTSLIKTILNAGMILVIKLLLCLCKLSVGRSKQ